MGKDSGLEGVCGASLLCALPMPACLVNGGRQIVFANTAFASLQSGTSMIRDGRSLILEDTAAETALGAALRDIFSGVRDAGSIFAQDRFYTNMLWVKVNRVSGSDLVLVSALLPDLVSISPKIVEARLRRLFGLSLMESRSALLLAEGATAKEIAKQRCVSVPTVRTQLAAVREKMGVGTSLSVAAMVARLSSPAFSEGELQGFALHPTSCKSDRRVA